MKLKHPKNSDEESTFLKAAKDLENIPGVRDFKVLKQTSPKNQFDYGLTMQFESQEKYDAYSAHPDHEAFLKQSWSPNVTDFLEIDYEELVL